MAAHVADADLTAGRECVVAFAEPNDYRSAVVVGVVGATAGGGGGVAGVYYVQDRPEIIVPVDAAAVSVVSGADAWSAWVQVTAGLGADFILTHILAVSVAGTVYMNGQIEVGVGAAGSEVAVAESEWSTTLQAVSGAGGVSRDPRRVQYYRIPAGTRIAVRAYGRSGSNTVVVYLQGYSGAGPTVQSLATLQQGYVNGTVTLASLNMPETGGLVVSSFVAWAWTAWVQATAAAPARMLVYGFDSGLPGAAFYSADGGLIQLGVGAAGSEVVRGAAGYCRGSSPMVLGHPVLVEAGERIAVRAKSAAAFDFPGIVVVADRLA